MNGGYDQKNHHKYSPTSEKKILFDVGDECKFANQEQKDENRKKRNDIKNRNMQMDLEGPSEGSTNSGQSSGKKEYNFENKKCCGPPGARFPYQDKINRQCCESVGKTYDSNFQECCESGEISALGTCL